MLTELWFWLFVAEKILECTCPISSNLGSLLGVAAMAGRYAFILLVLFFSGHWWWALLLIPIDILLAVIIPRPQELTPGVSAYSMICSHFKLPLVLVMYICLF